MAINPNIILGIQTPKFQVADPLESAHKSLALQALMGQQEMQGMQLQQGRRAMESEDRLRALFGENPNATPEDVMRIDPAKGMKMRQDALKNRETEANINKTRAEVMGKLATMHRERMGALMANPNAEDGIAAVNEFGALARSLGAPDLVQGQDRLIAAIRQNADNPTALKTIYARLALNAKDLLPQFQTRNTGGTTDTMAIDPVTGQVQVTNTVKNTVSPDAELTDRRTREEGALNRGVTIRGQNLTDARARETLVAGKAPAGYRFKADGTLEAIPGGPADGKADKLGEAAKKQITGIDALGSAIDDYVEAVKGWNTGKMLTPDERAKMGTKYNNMMLQAKEAYNLGVLNGPDYQILQSVIADPTQFRNALISSEAMAGQAEELKRMMERTRAAVKNQGKDPAPGNAAAQPAKPNMPAAPKSGDVIKGYRFKGGNPADKANWEKV